MTDRNPESGKPEPVRPAPLAETEEGTPGYTPTPVRDLMGPEPVPARLEPAALPAVPVPDPPPSRVFEVEGVTWIAEERGRTLTGRAADSGATLIFLGFRRSVEEEETESAGEEFPAPEREGWLAVQALDAAGEDELMESFSRSRQWRDSAGESGSGKRPGPSRQRLRTAGGEVR